MSFIYFSDITAKRWSRNFIYFLENKGTVQGTSASLFNPTGTVTVGELCAMVVRAANITIQNLADNWTKQKEQYVERVMEEGIKLSPFGSPSPDEIIQRQYAFNAAWHIVASSQSHTMAYTVQPTALQMMFQDYDTIDPEIRTAIHQVVENGIVTGVRDNSWKRYLLPQKELSREEISKVLALCLAEEEDIHDFALSLSVPINNGIVSHGKIIQQPQSLGYNLAASRQLTDIDRITVHHSMGVQNPSIETINSYWTNRSDGEVWSRAGYHFFIRGDGSIWQLVPIHTHSNGVGSIANPRSIHICFAGNFSPTVLPTQAAR